MVNHPSFDCPAIQPVGWAWRVTIDGPEPAAQEASELARLVAASDARALSLFGCHAAYHKEHRRYIQREKGDRVQALLRAREIAAQALFADETGGMCWELLGEGLQCDSQKDWRRASRAYREAMRPDKPGAYLKPSAVLIERGHCLGAAFACLAELCSSYRCRGM